jgi:hypothetical protein
VISFLIFINLKTADRSSSIEQSIDLSTVSGKIATTLLVAKFFNDIQDKLIGCAASVLLTTVSRTNYISSTYKLPNKSVVALSQPTIIVFL